jgi:hypothetical protein
VITADSGTGFKFSGSAQVSFNNVPPSLGVGAIAGTSGNFLDLLTILAPAFSGSAGKLVIPLHVTGSVSAVGTVVGPGIPHTGELTYNLFDDFGHSNGTIGLSTTGETLVCGPAACGSEGVPFNETRLVQLPFTFGAEFELGGSFGVDASFFLNAPPGPGGFIGGHTTASFDHTVTFGPATVLDAAGNVITDVTIISDIDYRAGTRVATAVPEPPTASLAFVVLAALPALWWLRRRHAARVRAARHRAA